MGQITSAAGLNNEVSGYPVNHTVRPWPSGYGDDATWNVSAIVSNTADSQTGIPSAALRGGGSNDGTGVGVFALVLSHGPSHQHPALGFRCVIPR